MPSKKGSSKLTRDEKYQIFIRDNFSCKCWSCNDGPQPVEALAVHHIDGDKRNHHPSNLTTMKRTCHSGYEARLRKYKRRYREFAKHLGERFPPTAQIKFPFDDGQD